MLSSPKMVRHCWVLFFSCIKVLIACVFQEAVHAELAEGCQVLLSFFNVSKC